MFDRFTDRARKVMSLAKAEAQRLNHPHIIAEHILLGLVKEGSGVAANVLMRLNVDLKRIRTTVEEIAQVSRVPVTNSNLPFTPAAKKVLELSVEAASDLGHNSLGTEHLLLGLIKQSEGAAARVLLDLGVTFEKTRDEIVALLGSDPRFSRDAR